jgi:hypothetical protein
MQAVGIHPVATEEIKEVEPVDSAEA